MWNILSSKSLYNSRKVRRKLLSLRLPRVVERSDSVTIVEYSDGGGLSEPDFMDILKRNKTRILKASETAPHENGFMKVDRMRCNMEVEVRHQKAHISKCNTCLRMGEKNPATNRSMPQIDPSLVGEENKAKGIIAEQLNSKAPVTTTNLEPPSQNRITRRYSPAEKREYMKAFAVNDFDVKKTSAELKVPEGTLRQWARNANIEMKRHNRINAKKLMPSNETKHKPTTSLDDSNYYNAEFKMKVISDIDNYPSYRELAKAYGLAGSTVTEWMRVYKEKGVTDFQQLLMRLQKLHSESQAFIRKVEAEIDAVKRIEGVADELLKNNSQLEFFISEKQRLLEKAGL